MIPTITKSNVIRIIFHNNPGRFLRRDISLTVILFFICGLSYIVKAQVPVNDNACNAITISLGLNIPFTNVNATTQTGEPAIPTGTCTAQGNWCSGESSPQVQHSVWFKFTVPATGTGSYAFRVNGTTGTFDSQEALFYATSCAGVTNGSAVRLGANDDSTSSLFNSYMTVYCLTPTLTYYLMVDGYGATTNASFYVDVIELTDRNAIANAGADQTVCYSLFPSVPVIGSALGVAGSTTWTTTGNGQFVNPAALSTSYIPGSADKISGQVRLVLSTNDPAGVCNASRDTMVLTIIADSLNAGNDKTICSGQQYIKMNGIANLFTSFQWSTLGDGTFNSSNTISADYFPGPNDRVAASFKLVLRGVSTQCFNTVYDTVEVFNVSGTSPVVNLGSDRSVCFSDSILISPVALSGYSSLNWVTSGDGHFNNATSTTVYYTPGTNDLSSGNVSIRFIAAGISPCQGIVEDTIKLTIKQAPRVIGFTSGNSFCSTSTIIVSANAQFYSSLNWITSGDGFFVTPNSLTSVYIPGNNDLSSGNVTVTIKALPVAPCLAFATLSMQINITRAPIVSLNVPAVSCNSSTFQVVANASSYQTLTWSTSGDGTFQDAFASKTKYTPGPIDIANGLVTFTITALGNNPCNAFVVNASTVITRNPSVFAGNDQYVCINSNVSVNATATNYSSLQWTTDGDGIFLNDQAASTIYMPGPFDYAYGAVNLFIHANSNSPCNSIGADALVVSFLLPATADAGISADIVAGQSVQLNGITQNAASQQWFTTGDGTFNNYSILNAIYTPGPSDIANNSVVVGLTAYSLPPCVSSSTDYFTISIFDDALLAIKLFIEGFYTGGSMVPALFASGISTNTSLSDYYVVRLHQSVSPFSSVLQDSIPLYANGLSFLNIPASLAGGSYYISIHHRNCLETWSRVPITVGAFGLYDFTTGSNMVNYSREMMEGLIYGNTPKYFDKTNNE